MNKDILVLIAQAHSKSTPGKRSPDGKFREYAWSREITKRIVEKLYLHDIKSIVINPEEEEVKLSVQCKRVNDFYNKYKNEYKEIVLISPHVNAGPKNDWDTPHGWTVFVYNKASQKSRNLAKIMASFAYDIYDLQGDRWLSKERIFEKNLAILRDTICPAVLSENMFMTNKGDVEFLNSETGKETIANLHVNAILKYKNDINK